VVNNIITKCVCQILQPLYNADQTGSRKPETFRGKTMTFDKKTTPLLVLGILTLLGGGCLGLYALSAPLGVWLGVWEFRDGFAMLQAVNTHAREVMWVCLGVSVAIIVAARVMGVSKSQRFFIPALIGTFGAFLSWYVPNSYAPGEGVPPIHDITTNTVNPPLFVDVVPLRVNAANSLEYTQDVAEQQLAAYPDIVPQYYPESVEQVFERALQVADDMNWELVSSDLAAGRIEATATTFWFRFKDDVVIYLVEDGNQTRLDARSVSRVGRSDVGKNAARLREFFELMAD
jgi:uncharacterized protein (DUF1499 family)/uncharacterized membrane protein (UPF0136 family)